MTSVLKIISTPIGNLGDISERCRLTFTNETKFLAEDTREFYKLLDLLGISKEGKVVESFNDHDQDNVTSLVSRFSAQGNLCIVSDAGSPVLSDPAYPLVKQWVLQGGLVESIPGASAVSVALEVSAMPPIPFSFHGFLPRKPGAIEDYIISLPSRTTHIFFESPHRIQTTLELIARSFGDYDVCVVRELTKKFEQHLRFKASDWHKFKSSLVLKGEFVLLLRNTDTRSSSGPSKELAKLVSKYLEKPSSKTLAKILAQVDGSDVNDIYKKISFSKK